MTWQLVILVGCLFLLDRLLRKQSATIRYGLWSLVLLRLLLPPAFTLPTGWGWWAPDDWTIAATTQSPSGFPPKMPEARQVPKPQTLALPPRSSAQRSRIVVAQPAERHSPSATPTPAFSPTSIVNGRPSAPSSPPSLRARIWNTTTDSIAAVRDTLHRWSLALLLVYCGFVCAQLGVLASSALQVRGWARRAQVISDHHIQALLDSCRERVGIRGLVELRNSESCTTPLVVGLFHPVILLPSTMLAKLAPDELAAVLTHELQHIRRRDGLVNLGQAFLGIAYFFNPIVWLANHRIRSLREDVCDELTVHTIDSGPKPYASALLKVAETLGYAAPPLAMGVLDGKTPLKKRMQRILNPSIRSINPFSLQATLATAVAALILLPAGANKSSADATVPPVAQRPGSTTAPALAVPPSPSPSSSPSPSPSPVAATPNPFEPPPSTAPVSRGTEVDLARLLEPKSTPSLTNAEQKRTYFAKTFQSQTYRVTVNVGREGKQQRIEGVATFDLLGMNATNVGALCRFKLRESLREREWLDVRQLSQPYAQNWTRLGVPNKEDGAAMPFIGSPLGALLLTPQQRASDNRQITADFPGDAFADIEAHTGQKSQAPPNRPNRAHAAPFPPALPSPFTPPFGDVLVPAYPDFPARPNLGGPMAPQTAGAFPVGDHDASTRARLLTEVAAEQFRQTRKNESWEFTSDVIRTTDDLQIVLTRKTVTDGNRVPIRTEVVWQPIESSWHVEVLFENTDFTAAP